MKSETHSRPDDVGRQAPAMALVNETVIVMSKFMQTRVGRNFGTSIVIKFKCIVFLYVYLSVCLSVYLFVYLCVCGI